MHVRVCVHACTHRFLTSNTGIQVGREQTPGCESASGAVSGFLWGSERALLKGSNTRLTLHS